MASVPVQAATVNYALGDSGAGRAARKVVQIIVGSLVGSFAVQGRMAGTSGSFLPISYKKHYLNGAVGDETYVSTAITGNSLFEVPATGMEIQLAYTHTSGTVTGASIGYLDIIE